MSAPLLSIRNNHALTSGDPPIASNSNDAYIGYFENMYGEQWIFTYDRPTKTASLNSRGTSKRETRREDMMNTATAPNESQATSDYDAVLLQEPADQYHAQAGDIVCCRCCPGEG